VPNSDGALLVGNQGGCLGSNSGGFVAEQYWNTSGVMLPKLTANMSTVYTTAGTYTITSNYIFVTSGISYTFNLPNLSVFGTGYAITLTFRCLSAGGTGNCTFAPTGSGSTYNISNTSSATYTIASMRHVEWHGYYTGGSTNWFQGFSI
jgi:hypothetical protein